MTPLACEDQAVLGRGPRSRGQHDDRLAVDVEAALTVDQEALLPDRLQVRVQGEGVNGADPWLMSKVILLLLCCGSGMRTALFALLRFSITCGSEPVPSVPGVSSPRRSSRRTARSSGWS